MSAENQSIIPVCHVHTFGDSDRLVVASEPLRETIVFRPECKQILVGLVFAGRLTLRLGSSRLAIAAGHCFLHRSPQPLAEWEATGTDAVFVAIEGRPLAERFGHCCNDRHVINSCLCCARCTGAIDRVHASNAGLRRLGRRLLAAPDGSIRQQLQFKTATLELWLAMLEHEHDRIHSPDGRPCEPVPCIDRLRLERVVAHLEENLSEEHSLAGLCRLFGLNECKLKRQFKLCYGDTVFGHLRTLRLERAHELLASGEHNVTEVALAVGYSNPSHFAAAYAERFGRTPRQDRNLFSDTPGTAS